MRLAPRAILAGVLGVAASFIVACGGGAGLLSTDQAGTLNDQLDRVSQSLATGNCTDVSSATNNLSSAVGDLPASVNATLRNNLSQGAERVAQLSARECNTANTNTDTTTTQTTTTQTTPTTHTQTQTTPTTPTHTQTTPTTPPTTTATTPATTGTSPGTTTTGTSGGAGIGGNSGSSGGAGTGNGNGGNGNGGNGQ
jgi:hypothetical protein